MMARPRHWGQRHQEQTWIRGFQDVVVPPPHPVQPASSLRHAGPQAAALGTAVRRLLDVLPPQVPRAAYTYVAVCVPPRVSAALRAAWAL